MSYTEWKDKTANFNKTIKKMEKQGKERSEIVEILKEKFGEKNPDVKV